MFVYSGIPSTLLLFFFFFNDTATTEIYTLSLHDALPISSRCPCTTVWPQPSPLHASSSPNSARRNRSGGADLPIARHHERRGAAARRRDEAREHLLGDEHHVREQHDGRPNVGAELLETLVQRAARRAGEIGVHDDLACEPS